MLNRKCEIHRFKFFWGKKPVHYFPHKVSLLDKVGKFNQSFAEWQTSGWSLISAQINVVNRRTFSLQHVVHCIKLFTSAHLHTLTHTSHTLTHIHTCIQTLREKSCKASGGLSNILSIRTFLAFFSHLFGDFSC